MVSIEINFKFLFSALADTSTLAPRVQRRSAEGVVKDEETETPTLAAEGTSFYSHLQAFKIQS
ncbi:MAG: hypothetical protein CO034_00815 [Parcubacteria group bacterium CG_4_9_14_0_2_um_filter_35_11]|nr:MAG: hypothetical protein COS98_00305 [Parcubacteria group bacterium CG07_land_8_20_14_0_80_35_11]PJC47924.1 MAG: hypothetical protein CO034_00815 [Parcubacteria group bacterium CG_4_9_14_0_2_um_filter_35_11]